MDKHEEIYEILNTDPGTGIHVADRNGVLLYINEAAIRFFFQEGVVQKDIIGKNGIENGFPKEWVDERVAMIREIEQTGEEQLLRTVWQGRQQFSWFRPLEQEEGEDFRVLVVTRRVGGGEEADLLLDSEMTVVKSTVTGLGDLAVLTKREIEVLALIGQGLKAKEIAAIMNRSVKTIENHRISLGNKLQKSNKVELALIAREAGLMVDDSARSRMRIGSNGGRG